MHALVIACRLESGKSLMLRSVQGKEQFALVTCSFRPDFERCVRLCESTDTLLGETAPHVIVVPDRDKKIFRPLESRNRMIVSTQDILPARYRQLPIVKKWWLDSGLWPVRGWMLQQVTKLCADAVTEHENIIFVDSDIEFIRPLQGERFFKGRALRLHRKPMHANEGTHLSWHHTAGELLGLAPRYFGSDYIGPLATWRRSNLIQLKDHIENCVSKPWFEAVGRRLTVSEYTLYGVFVEQILGINKSGHFENDEDLCHCLWSADQTEKFLTECDYENSPQAVLMQSNIGLDQTAVSALMGKLRQKLAA